jgi:DNA-binding beta-propeller fold protein YncE
LCYITDANSNRVVVLDKRTGDEVSRIGQEGEPGEPGMEKNGEFRLIGDLALDLEGNIYVTDKVTGQITKFDKSGIFQRTIGKLGRNIDELARPKGISIDREGRIWLVDALSEVVKIMDAEGRLLLFFGLPGNAPGNVNLPSRVKLDYDNVGLFEQYAVPGAKLEFLVIVANQYGLNKINVYGFGSFPEAGAAPATPE